MAEAIVSDPVVGALQIEYENGSVSGVSADVAYHIQVDGLSTKVSKRVDAWGLLNSNQKSAYQAWMGLIAESAEA